MTRAGNGEGQGEGGADQAAGLRASESDDDVAPGGLDVSPDSDGEGSQSEDVAPFRSAVASAWWQRILFEPAQYELTRFAVLRLLGFVYFVAFGSLALQVLPLYGSHGLAPIAMDLPSLREQVGARMQPSHGGVRGHAYEPLGSASYSKAAAPK